MKRQPPSMSVTAKAEVELAPQANRNRLETASINPPSIKLTAKKSALSALGEAAAHAGNPARRARTALGIITRYLWWGVTL